MTGLIGLKIGMTSRFITDGILLPITVIKIEKNYITQIKSPSKDGYSAIQVTTGNSPPEHRISKSLIGHLSKSGVVVGRGLWEWRINEENLTKFNLGQILTVNVLANINKVDITGTSKGKGFAGTVKRWNFCTQDASHGNSLSHRVPGSIGQNQTPGKVFKGKKMAGHMGNKRVTIQNIKIINIDMTRNLLLVKGAVPGANGDYLRVKPAIKTNEVSKNIA